MYTFWHDINDEDCVDALCGMPKDVIPCEIMFRGRVFDAEWNQEECNFLLRNRQGMYVNEVPTKASGKFRLKRRTPCVRRSMWR